MKKVLVTGGAGFLGSHLCDILAGNGCRVICVDNLSTGMKANIAHLSDNECFEFFHHDVLTPLDLEGLDEVYHLACPASPVQYQHHPIHTFETAILGTLNLLRLAHANSAKFLLASTSEVYGDPLQHPQQENYWGNVNPVGIRSCYDEGKRGAETITMDFYRMYKLKIKIARIFNTYGSRMQRDDGRVVSNFMVQALNGDAITIYGTGEQTRSFCYVSDLVHGLVALMESGDDVLGPVNLGNPAELKIMDIAGQIVAMAESSSEVVFKPLPEDDPLKRKPDISLARDVLGWEPKVSLAEGLRRTMDYFGDYFTE